MKDQRAVVFLVSLTLSHLQGNVLIYLLFPSIHSHLGPVERVLGFT
jgi:hypothetical protein